MPGSMFLRESPFAPYGASHWVILVLFATLAVLLVGYGRRIRETPRETRLRRTFALLLLSFQLPLQIYSMLPPAWDLGRSLPFQLCDLAWMIAVYALWTGRQWAFGLLHYWGLTLTSQALLTPQLEFDFPHLQFVMFWLSHSLVVLAAIYMTWGGGWRPDWRSMVLALGVTVSWGCLMLGFNALAGTNYLYVNRKPPGASVLDLLGDWPAYVVVEILVLAVVWSLMTLPWTRRRTVGVK